MDRSRPEVNRRADHSHLEVFRPVDHSLREDLRREARILQEARSHREAHHREGRIPREVLRREDRILQEVLRPAARIRPRRAERPLPATRSLGWAESTPERHPANHRDFAGWVPRGCTRQDWGAAEKRSPQPYR